jgi:hypothetical protein
MHSGAMRTTTFLPLSSLMLMVYRSGKTTVVSGSAGTKRGCKHVTKTADHEQ